MSGSTPLRVLIVEDCALEAIVAIISRQPDMQLVAQAGSSSEAVQGFRGD